MSDTVSQIIAWENGELDSDAEIQFFQDLIDSGIINGLQGCYQRRAYQLLNDGLIEARKGDD